MASSAKKEGRRSSPLSLAALLLVLLVATSLVVLAAAQESVFPPVITIAGLFPLTGARADLGSQAESASRIAVENVNKEGVIRATTTVTLTSYDTSSSEEV